MGVSFKSKGDWSKTYKYLNKIQKFKMESVLTKYGEAGVRALSEMTPKDSGQTASSWNYKIESKGNRISISWTNSHIVNNVNIAIILQYGHGTGTGGYVAGRDYINPALRPIFDKMTDEMWKEVTRD